MAVGYQTLELSPRFLADLISDNFAARDRRRFLRALQLLDENERHPSLRVHQLEGRWPARGPHPPPTSCG